MAMYQYDIQITRGDTFDKDIEFEDNTISLSGKSAKSQVRPKLESDVLLAEMYCNVDSTKNNIHLSLTSQQTSNLQPGTYAYDVFLLGTGFRKCYIGGKFIVEGRATIVEDEKITISGTVTWIDDNNPNRPSSVVIHLWGNGEAVAMKTVTAEANWEYSFTNIDKSDGIDVITYTITEEDVEGYYVGIDGYNVVNTLIGNE